MSELENNDDGTDQTHIPPEFDHESDCDEVSDESYSCRSTDQNYNNKNYYHENSNTEKLSDCQNWGTNLLIHQPTTVSLKKHLSKRSKRNNLTRNGVGE